MAISLKLSSPVMLLLLLAALMLVLVPQPTRYILRTQSGDVLDNVDVSWIEDLEYYPPNDCGHSMMFHLSRIVNLDQNERERLDPCTMLGIGLKELMQRVLDRIKRDGFELVKVLPTGQVVKIIADGDLSYAAWKKVIEHPYFYKTLLDILMEIQKEAGLGNRGAIPPFIIR
jgi:hypothetical protein